MVRAIPATKEMTLATAVFIYSSSANDRGQGTAHLVRCTLDPIVRLTFLLPLSKVPVAEIGIDRFPSVGSDWGSQISMRGQDR